MTHKSIAILVAVLAPGLCLAQQFTSAKTLCQGVARHPAVFQSCVKMVQQGRATNAMIEEHIRNQQNAAKQAAQKKERQRALEMQQQQMHQQSRHRQQTVQPMLVNPTPAYRAPRINPPQFQPTAPSVTTAPRHKKPKATQPSGFHIQYD